MNYLNKKTVEDIDVAGKRVLVRCDFNVPFDGKAISATPSGSTRPSRPSNT